MIRAVRLSALLLAAACGCSRSPQRQVVIYTSVDEPFSRPIIEQFGSLREIRPLGVFDTEAAKTVGLARRLLAEGDAPRCDVFWSNEFLQTVLLAEKDLFAPRRKGVPLARGEQFADSRNRWVLLGGRLRVLLLRPGAFKEGPPPSRIFDLAAPRYRGQGAIAQPVAGTTLTHFVALYAALGRDRARRFFTAVIANGIKVVPGNSVAKDMVVEGEVSFCLTDSDDAAKAMARDPSLRVAIPDQEEGGLGAFLIPGTVSVVAGAPHMEAAEAFLEYLLAEATVRRLLQSGAFQIPLRSGVPFPADSPYAAAVHLMQVSPGVLCSVFEEARRALASIFLR